MLLSAYVFDFQCKIDSLRDLAGSYTVQIKKNWKEYLGPFESVECRAVPHLCMCLFLMVTSPSRFPDVDIFLSHSFSSNTQITARD